MKQFRLIVGEFQTAWLNAAEWTLEHMKQFEVFENYYIEWR